jgi:hypothetical protein
MPEILSGDEQFPVIARFEIRRRAYLAPDGTGLTRLPSFAFDIALLVSFYRAMVLARAFDLKAVSLQRTGRLGTYAVALGQEAVNKAVIEVHADVHRGEFILDYNMFIRMTAGRLFGLNSGDWSVMLGGFALIDVVILLL